MTTTDVDFTPMTQDRFFALWDGEYVQSSVLNAAALCLMSEAPAARLLEALDRSEGVVWC